MLKKYSFGLIVFICFLLAVAPLSGAAKSEKIAKQKQFTLNWLSLPETIEKFGRISDTVWSFAELGMQEFSSSKLLADTLEEAGFSVERGEAGMPTCFVATYGSGKPVIGFLGEFDALPMISQKGRVPRQEPLVDGAPGHGCGHNTMCTAAVGAAIAVKKTMEEFGLKGTIKVFGSPAEETLISRPYMVRAGLFKDVDIVIDNHSSSTFATGYGKSGNAMFSTVFTFKGQTSHGASPWTALSALDAVEIMNVATNYLREHLFYTYRMHYVIVDGGQAPNVVPDKASVWYFIRNSDERLKPMYERVINCAKAAALATGTELEQIRCYSAVHQRVGNKVLAELFQKNIELVGMPEWTEEDQEFARQLQKELGREETGMPSTVRSLRDQREFFVGGGSSDVAEVSRVCPTATIAFPGQVPGSIGHHWSSVATNYGNTAWLGLNAGAKAMAASAVDLLMSPKKVQEIRDEFNTFLEKNPYEPFLPEDARPPLELNRELMDKYRTLLEKHHLKIF
ncbi:MAG: amidohydrolase [Acidobacteria bacterium]|nr:amidohydrolase [Acidobacteriota bacterium]MBU1339468.1 amidohydrolase [Acidobacteriota bacterium]MBU1473541.1 amidohydrolase [Acidobacteriota bacterium]